MTGDTTVAWPDEPIMIVDDDPMWVQALMQALEALGWQQVRALSDPTLVVELAFEFKPAVVLLDLRMGQRDGHAVLRDLQRELPQLPVIMVTAVERIDQAVACIREGASDYLTKPLRRGDLVRALGRVLEERRAAALTAPAPVVAAVASTGLGEPADDLDTATALTRIEELPGLKEVNDLLIDEALKRSNGVLKDAAAMLKVSPQALCNRRRRRRCQDVSGDDGVE